LRWWLSSEVYGRGLKLLVNFSRNGKEVKMSDREGGTSFVVGFVVGAAIGLAIGFLYAPRPGAETRELLKEKAEKVKEKATEVAEKVKETAAEARKKAEEKYEEVKEKTQ
jgi:hypothetical protein